MRTLPALALSVLSATVTAAENGELPLTVLTAGISQTLRPALAVGAFAGGFGIRQEPSHTVAGWLPEFSRYDVDLGTVFGELKPPAADGPLLVLAALPMPWRPTAIERDGASVIIHGDAIDADAATPEMTGEPAATLKATHEFALSVSGAGVGFLRLSVTRHGGLDDRGKLTTSSTIAEGLRSTNGVWTSERLATARAVAIPVEGYGWVVPRVVVLTYGGGDHEEGLVGVGEVDLKTESKQRPLPVRGAGFGTEYVAEIVTPVLQSGEWAQLRSVEWLGGVCHIGVALFQDQGGRDKNIPHRDALVVPLHAVAPAIAGAGAAPPRVEVAWLRLMADQPGGVYAPLHQRIDGGELKQAIRTSAPPQPPISASPTADPPPRIQKDF